MAYAIVDGVIVYVPILFDNVFTANDGSGEAFSPTELYGFTAERESANLIQERSDASIAVIIRGDRPRSGTFSMIFDDDVDADRAMSILARRCTFTLTNLDRPSLGMSFVRQGRIGAVVHDEVRQVWEFTVGYQEVTA